MGWRTLEVNGEQYRWRGSHNVVIQNSEGKRISEPTLTAAGIKDISNDAWERGHWKRTTDGMLTPADIKNYIIKTLDNRDS